MTRDWIAARIVSAALGLVSFPSLAENPPAPPAPEQVLFTPLLGIKGGTVSGKLRGTVRPATPLPTIDILAPIGYSGLTTSAAPNLFFYVSRSVSFPMRFTISAPRQPAPVIETNIPSPEATGIYAIHLADYRVRLETGIIYTWSVSIILNPSAPSRDIVASATLVRVPLDADLGATMRAAPAPRRAALFASHGLWYDAIAEADALNQRAFLDTLIQQLGLIEPPRFDQEKIVGAPSR